MLWAVLLMDATCILQRSLCLGVRLLCPGERSGDVYSSFVLTAVCSSGLCALITGAMCCPHTLLPLNWGAGRAVGHGVLLSVWPGLGDRLLGLDSSWGLFSYECICRQNLPQNLIVNCSVVSILKSGNIYFK